MDLGISGKTGLVTGASSGIGRGVAFALAAEGVKIAIVARRGNLLEEVATLILANGYARPAIIECDLMREDAATAVANAALSYTHLRAHETRHDLVCRLLLEKNK